MTTIRTRILKHVPSFPRQQQQELTSDFHGKNTAVMTPQQRVLRIPEILRTILAFVSLHDRQRSARLVNRQWYFIYKSLAPAYFIWPLCLSDNENRIAQDLVRQTRNLKIHFAQDKVEEIRQKARELGVNFDQGKVNKKLLDSWTLNMSIISESIQDCGQPKLESLHLTGEAVVDFLVQLQHLPTLHHLTTFKISINELWDIRHLDAIFNACPNLYELAITSNSHKSPRNETYASPLTLRVIEPLVNTIQLQPMIYLRRCVLHLMLFTAVSMESFLKVCPQLTDLVLFQMCGLGRASIIDLVKKHCPKITKFYFSHRWWGDYEENIYMLEHFPNLEEYTFRPEDINPALIVGLRIFVNHVTTLNLIFTEPDEISITKTASIDLREILCTFVHLVHLRAPFEGYRFGDIYIEALRSGILPPWTKNYVYEWKAPKDDPDKKYTWVCRGLKTLRIGVNGGDFFPVNISHRFLTVFGFISRMCPQLQELHLSSDKLDMSFLGGMCQLTRLQDLRRIKIIADTWYKNRTRISLCKRDFFWLRDEPFMEERINYKKILAQNWIRSRNRLLYSNLSVEDGSLPLLRYTDIREYELGEDLLQWMEERYGGHHSKIWPNLQQFHIIDILDRNNRNREIESFISKIRPNVDVQFRNSISTRPHFEIF